MKTEEAKIYSQEEVDEIIDKVIRQDREFLCQVLRALPWQMLPGLKQKWIENPKDLQAFLRDLNPALKPSVPAEPAAPPTPREKFYFVKAIKITIPKDYVHGTRMNSFGKENHKKFNYYNELATDENFANVTDKLVPGRTYIVKIFGIESGQVASGEDCVAKYRQEKAFFVGAQGASFVWEQRRKELPKGKYYASFDEKKKLPVADGYHRVPCVSARSYVVFYFFLGLFEDGWGGDGCLLCFCDEEQPSEPSTLQK